ncbi:MAG: 4-vinyl reductase, partial [Desulfobacterales bacterium]
MNNNVPLYNSRLTKNYLDYLGKHHPDVNIDSILEYAGMTRYEVEDPAHWFNQKQIDDFQKIVVLKTGDRNISRKVGRYTASGGGFGAAKQLMIGLMSPTAGYLLTEKYYPILSRGAVVKAKKVGPTQVEIVSTPNPVADEKPYQCENRAGTFEAIARLFTDTFANVDHPECFHKGDRHCRYVITWKMTAALVWKRIRNYVLLLSGLCSLVLFGFLSVATWSVAVLAFALLSAGVSYYAEYLVKKELTQTVAAQKTASEDLILESNIRYNNALLVQEIGQAASKILPIDELLKSVTSVMEKRLEFDRGLIMLAN